MIDVQSVIATRRDRGVHTKAELFGLAKTAADGTIPDYQLSAWLMAAYLNPLSAQETSWLTDGMARSGEIMDLSGLPHPWVDKHSTGGVGDKTTISLLPILAACGLTLVKMSGRGLGITGGTIDKLAAIPGFRTNLSPAQLKQQALSIGLALTGQTPDLAPADKVIYALRDATGTVGSIPLIVSSILSKKIAGGAEVIVLDVKCGSGAFMDTEARARELAESLASVGRELGLNLRLAISDMSQPLGEAVGNALEVREAIRIVRNDALTPQEERYRRLVLEMAAHTLVAAGKATTHDAGVSLALSAIESGAARQKMASWFRAQGATVDVVAEPDALPKANVILPVTNSKGAGWVSRVDALTVGRNVMRLGGGRKRKEDTIDVTVGMSMHCHVGLRVAADDLLFTVHAPDEETAHKVAGRTLEGIDISRDEVPERALILATL